MEQAGRSKIHVLLIIKQNISISLTELAEMPNHDRWSHPWTVHTSRLLMLNTSIKKVHKTFSWCVNAGKLKTEQKPIALPCLLCLHPPPYLLWRKIGNQSHSAKFLNWGDHVNSVPDFAASPPSLLTRSFPCTIMGVVPVDSCRTISGV